MIYKDEKQVVVQFGTGDVMVTSGEIQGVAVLGLNQWHEDTDIGTLSDSRHTVETLMESDVFMVFNSIKSIEVLILKLQEARSMVINGEYCELDKFSNITDIYQPNDILRG